MKPFEGARVVLWAQEPKEIAPVERLFRKLGSRVELVTSAPQLRELVAKGAVDAIVARLVHSFTDPLDWLSYRRPDEASLPLLVVVDVWDKDLYGQALRRGALDAVVLPLDEKELVRIASRALASTVQAVA